jgi:hypothetical protein
VDSCAIKCFSHAIALLPPADQESLEVSPREVRRVRAVELVARLRVERDVVHVDPIGLVVCGERIGSL